MNYVYDADGNRAARIVGGQTTVYAFGAWEDTIGVNARKLYSFGGAVVAQRDNAGVTYLHGDHLGSVSVVTDANGNLASRQEFGPWGNVRAGGVGSTTLNYTGQRLDGTGLLFYNARYYDPAIGRFISADSVISNPANPQTFNRYAYVTNNPLRYTDPTGHVQCDGGSACFTGGVGGVRGGGGGPGNPVKGLKQAIVALFVWAGSVIAGNAASKKPVEWPNYPRTKVADPLPKDKRLEDGATDFGSLGIAVVDKIVIHH